MVSVFWASLKIMSQKINLKKYDGLVVWCDGMGDMITFRNQKYPIFNICSTPLRAVFDPVYIKQALSERGLFARIVFKIFQQLFKAADKMAWKKYSGVIATSTEVKNRIISGGLYKEGPSMSLFYPGIDWYALEGDKEYEPFLLVPGRIMWTKNVELALKAFMKAKLPEPWRLVVAGFLDEKSKVYLKKLKQISNSSKQIYFEISPTDKKLDELYRKASVILFPPLNEDWGIVPIEAMANSKPVLANCSGGPAESIVHKRTGWLAPPDIEKWGEIIKSFPENTSLIKTMGEKAREHSKKYDWSAFVNGIDNSLEEWRNNWCK
jgi:glycosyltransferase involved in cell wall biosynthesis